MSLNILHTGFQTRFELKISNCIFFSFLNTKNGQYGYFNELSKFESKILHYKQDTEFDIQGIYSRKKSYVYVTL